MAQPNLFLSHSTRDQAEARDLMKKLAGFRVFLAELDVPGGAGWRTDIDQALACSDCAVVLLSQNVLQKPEWVGAETAILRFLREKAGRSSLLIVPVLLPGFTREHLKHPALAPAQLDERQAVVLDEGEPALKLLEAGLAPLRLLGAQFEHTAGVESDVAALLEKLGRNALDNLAADLQLDPAVLKSHPNPARWLAAHLLRVPCDTLEKAHTHLRAINAEVAASLFRAVAPYCWIGEDAARQVASVGNVQPPQHSLALVAQEPKTPRLYVRRASPRLSGWSTIPSEALSDDDQVEALKKSIGLELRRLAGIRPGKEAKREDVLRNLRNVLPIFVVLPDWFADIDKGALASLRGDFPELIFLLWTKHKVDGLQTRFDQLLLLPELPQEDDLYNAYYRCVGGEPQL